MAGMGWSYVVLAAAWGIFCPNGSDFFAPGGAKLSPMGREFCRPSKIDGRCWPDRVVLNVVK